MKTILLATTGMSPAVLTETVWALARENPAVVPDEVYVVTTVSGAAKLKEQLFGADAVWETLRKNILGKKAGCDNRLVFDPADIVVARKKLGGKKIALDALADVSDHTAFADTLCSKLWEFTSQPGTRVIASLAGGYKTMSALMLSAMQLLANDGDRCTHVLVSGGLDAPGLGFFFPTTKAQAGCVQLIDIPLIPLRRWFDRHLGHKPPPSYADLVARADSATRPSLEVGPYPAFAVNGARQKLARRPYTYLRFFAECAKEGRKPFTGLDDIATALAVWKLDDFNLADLDPSAYKMNKHLSELRKKLPALAPFLPKRGCWKLDLPPAAITLR